MSTARLRWRGATAIAGLTIALVSGVGAGAGTAHAAPANCGNVQFSTISSGNPPLVSWSENVGYDADNTLWVSRNLQNTVERYDANGRVTAHVTVDSPGAVRLGPDNRLYVTSGNTPLNQIPGSRNGRVVAIDTSSLAVSTFARNLGMPNGLAFDAAGNAYVADSAIGIMRITRDGRLDAAWNRKAPGSYAPSATVNGLQMNGIAIDGDTIYASMTMSLSSRILAVSISSPDRVRAVSDITAPLPGYTDDLAVLPGGLLAVTTTTGGLALVNPRSGATCTRQLLAPLTAVAADPATPGQLIVTTLTGDLLRVRLA